MLLFALLQLVATSGEPDDALLSRITPEVEVVQSAGPAVVYIKTNIVTEHTDFFGNLFRGSQQGSGSGVVIYEDGFIVTNNHVIAGAKSIEVQFDPSHDTRTYPARVISTHPREDLALLKIDGGPFHPIPLGRSDDLMIGERVLAIGMPYGQTHTVSAGIISGLHRDVQAAGIQFENLIQTDASINPGNSGGPLLNIHGQLIGINTAMNTAAENIGFALPVDHVREVLQDYLLSPDAAQAWVGFSVDFEDLRISEVVPGSPADRVELQSGDRIVSIDGRAVETEEDYRRLRLALEPRQPIRLTVDRGGKPREVELVALGRAEGLVFEVAGLEVTSLVLGRRRSIHTVEVTNVRPGSPAESLGLRPGDIFDYLQPEGQWQPTRVRNPEELAVLLSRLKPGQDVAVEVWRDENENGRLERRGDYSELFSGTLRSLRR